jgi:hypothetical protein
MKALKHVELDCQMFSGYAGDQVKIESVEDLSGKVPHVVMGGAQKSMYISQKTGKPVWVLERNEWYAGDAYTNDVWLFDADFSIEEAAAFIRDWKADA